MHCAYALKAKEYKLAIARRHDTKPVIDVQSKFHKRRIRVTEGGVLYGEETKRGMALPALCYHVTQALEASRVSLGQPFHLTRRAL